MMNSLRPFRRSLQPTLFELACPNCPLYSSCDGADSAPCKCMYTSGNPEYRQCGSCSYICRERFVELGDGEFDTFYRRFKSLTPLPELRITQSKHSLPSFIPAKTYELAKGTNIDSPWVAIDLKKLPIATNFPITNPINCWYSAERLRECLRIGQKSRLLAVLNGTDDRLERFWGSDRFAFYEVLKHCGVTAITGPTFSVHELDRDSGRFIPESEKVVNMMRHHRVLQEIDSYFDLPIPNLYWRNEIDIANWAAWLREHEDIQYISRDLTCRAQREIFLSDLVLLIEQVKRPLHIVILGVGSALVRQTIQRLDKVGYSYSFVSSDPILKAVRARKKLQYNGKCTPTVQNYSGQDYSYLALHNLNVMNQHIQQPII